MFKKFLLASCAFAAMLSGIAQATPIHSDVSKFGYEQSFDTDKFSSIGEFDTGSSSAFHHSLIYRGGKGSGFSGFRSYDEAECGECQVIVDQEPRSVPEPATLALFGLGLLGLGLSRRRKI